jgi:hypothetical protein
LLLADISGYTGFLGAVSEAHGEEMRASGEIPAAYPLMTSLLDGIVERVVPPFDLSKFEGDAVFAFAPDGAAVPRGSAVLGRLQDCYSAFVARLHEARDLMWCSCNACSRINELDLKFVLHHGEYVSLSISGREELLGHDVTVAHRLLKNHVTEVVRTTGYALITEAAIASLEVPIEGAVPVTEDYERIGPIRAFVVELR